METGNKKDDIKLPDDFVSGNEPLEGDDEILAFGLLKLAIRNAYKIVEDKDFLSSLGKSALEERDNNRITLELSMFNLFLSSLWVRRNYQNFTPIFNRMYFHFQKMVGDNSMKFMDLQNRTHNFYEKAIQDTSRVNSLEKLCNQASKYILGVEELKDSDHQHLLMLSLYLADFVPAYTAVVKDFVENKLYLNKDLMDSMSKR